MYEQQDEQLAAFDANLREQAVAREAHWDERIEHTRQIKLTEKDKEISQIQRRRIKALRKLSEARKTIEPKVEKPDVVTSYADYGSDVYAPLTRNGLITRDKLAHQYDTNPVELTSYEGLMELERSLPSKVVSVSIMRPDKGKPTGFVQRSEHRLQEQLKRTDAAIKATKQTNSSEREQKAALLAAYRNAKPVERPPTPSIVAPEPEAEVEVACVLLQQLLRGRAIQNMMYEGKERRLELIKELRFDEEMAIEDIADEEGQDEDQDALQVAADGLQAELVGTSLDTTSKELRRFQEERRIAELVCEAERTRRVREAEESGRRQRDMIKRSEEQECFRQLMRAHNSSAASYVSELLEEVCRDKASAQASNEAIEKRTERAGVESKIQDRFATPSAVAMDVVDNFLLAEVQRQQELREAELERQKFSRATSSALGASLAQVEAASLAET